MCYLGACDRPERWMIEEQRGWELCAEALAKSRRQFGGANGVEPSRQQRNIQRHRRAYEFSCNLIKIYDKIALQTMRTSPRGRFLSLTSICIGQVATAWSSG